MSRVSGTGSYGNSHFQHEQSEFDVDARRKLDGLGPVKPQLTAEEIKVAYEDALREDKAQKDQAVSIENAEAWIAGHPEFVKTPANIALMNHELKSKFGVRAYSIADYDQAYASLRSSNFLNLNKTVIEAQKKQAAKEKFATETARSAARAFDPNANYEEMSLEEIRDRANEEIRQKMQAAGERGGNGW